MPLVCCQVYGLRVFGHHKTTTFFANDAATCMTHGEVRVHMLMARYAFPSAAVVHVESGTIVGNGMLGTNACNHSVCEPVVVGWFSSGLGGVTYSPIAP